MADKDLQAWLKKQMANHRPEDKITLWQKVNTVPQYYTPVGKTWGDWYKAAGLKYDESAFNQTRGIDVSKPDKTTIVDIREVDNAIRKKEMRLNVLRPELDKYDTGTPEFKKIKAEMDSINQEIKDLKVKKQTTVVQNKVDDAAEKQKAAQKKLDDLAEARKRAEASGVETDTISAQEKAAKAALEKANASAKAAAADKKKLKPTGPTGPVSSVTGTKTGTVTSTATKPAGTTSGTTGGTTGGSTGGATGGTTTTQTDAQQRAEALGVAAEADFALPETLFKNVPSLNALLKRYVDEDWTPEKLRKEIRNDIWFRQNSDEIKKRYIQLYNYRDLVSKGQATGSTDYEKQIATLERQITDKARSMGSNIASDPAALRRAAENMYITNVGIEDAMTTDFIAAAIKPITSMIGGQLTEGYSGQALQNYQTLQGIAKANGFKLSDIVPGARSEQQVLQGIATGALDINRISQDARKLAAQGQPQYVRDLLGQGYNLDQIMQPYRNTMANVLEIDDPNSIDLNDPTLRSAISDKGDLNIYDFKKLLKQDKRWQYTENARQEVSDAAFKVLRDFGFQG